MAVTQNTYTGNGSTVLFSFTFPYLETTDIKVSVNGSTTTAYTLASPTTVQFNTAPANGASIRIYRATDDSGVAATFFPGSAIRSQDLNDNFTQNLYVTQEANNVSAAATTTANAATTTANTALSNSNTAITTANAATATANTASSDASAAVTTANAASATATTASTNASAAVTTANTALSTADAATTTANNATSTANAATATANTAATNATSAVNTANTAQTTATNAVTTANSAVTTANAANATAASAVTTANGAATTATGAVTTANTALSTANAAASAVANAILYDTVANVAAIPASPANNDAVEVVDSTGIQSFTPLSGKPAGFTGDSGLSVRIVYTTTGNTWNWIQYFPNDPENRYGDAIVTLQGDVADLATDLGTAQTDILGLDSAKLDATIAASTYQTQSGMSSYLTTSAAGSTYAPLTSPTFTGTVTIPAGASISGYLTSATAASTYQTTAGMSSYLTTSSAASTYLSQSNASSTYAPLASPTFTGTVTIPAGASISGYLATSTASSTYLTQSAASLTYAPLASPTFSGTVSDAAGSIRDIPQNPKSSAYTLASSDAGKHISIATGGITVPPSVFSVGSAVTIYNDSGSVQAITQASGVTIRQAGTANTGNRTLAQYGLATLLCVSSNTFVISGAGLT